MLLSEVLRKNSEEVRKTERGRDRKTERERESEVGALNSSDINLLSRYFRLESPPREKQISLAGSALPVHLNPSLPVFFFMSLGFCHSQPIHFFFLRTFINRYYKYSNVHGLYVQPILALPLLILNGS